MVWVQLGGEKVDLYEMKKVDDVLLVWYRWI